MQDGKFYTLPYFLTFLLKRFVRRERKYKNPYNNGDNAIGLVTEPIASSPF